MAAWLRRLAVPLGGSGAGLGVALALGSVPGGWPALLVAGGVGAYACWRWAPAGPERTVGFPALVVAAAALPAVAASEAMRQPVGGLGAGALLVVVWCGLWLWYGPLLRRAVPAPPGVHPILLKWDEHMVSLGLPGVRARVVGQRDGTAGRDSAGQTGTGPVGQPGVVHLELTLPVGRALRDIGDEKVMGRLAVMVSHALVPTPVPPDALRIERDASRAHVGHLFVELSHPLSRRRPYAGPSTLSHRDPIRPIWRADGTAVAVSFAQRHMAIAGRSGSGKSSLVMLAALEAATPDTLLLGVDTVKHGTDLGPIRAAFHRMVTEPADIEGLLRSVIRAREARARWMAEHGIRDWPTSPERPRIVLVVDEIAGVIRSLGSVELLNQLAAEGRQQGIQLILGTQRWKTENTGGSSGLLSQMHVLVSGRQLKRDDGADLFGHDRVAEGWWVHRLAEKGEVLVWADGELEVPTPYGTYWLETEDAMRFAEMRAATRSAPDPETAAALEPRAVEVFEPVADETAEELLARLLQAAGGEPLGTGVLVDAVRALPADRRKGRSWTCEWLRDHARDAGHGRWAWKPGAKEE